MIKTKGQIITTVLSFYLIALVVLVGTIGKVNAAGVAVSLTPSALTASTPTDVTFSYTSSVNYASGNTVSIVAPAGVTVANCSSSTTDADGDSTPDGSASVSLQTYTYTFSASTTTANSTGVDFCVNYSATTGNYGLSFTDSKTVPSNNDYGSALIYVGSANVVTVTASVNPALSFIIRNSADNGNTNTCALGVLSLIAVNTCSYRLKVTTNAGSGFVVQVNSDGDLRKSGSGNVADNLDIDLVAEDSTVTSGIEGYGIALTGGSITGGTVTEAGDFSDDDTPLPISSATNILTTNGTNNPGGTDTTNTALVTHRAAMDGDTTTGNYTQLVTYTVSASF
ncbi:hypothetical protein IT418_02735 [bacterium]|nr:hypothetical protein [bacterium]